MYRDPGYGEYRLNEGVCAEGRSVLVNTNERPYVEDEAAEHIWADTAVTYEDTDIGADLPRALRLMQQAAEYEARARESCLRLSAMAGAGDREIFSGISKESEKHCCILRRIYREITNESLPSPARAAEGANGYMPALEQAFLKAQRAAADYRDMLFAMRTREHVNMMTHIVTDKLRHLALFNMLLAKAYAAERRGG